MSLSKTKFNAGDEVLANDMNEIVEGLIDAGYIKTNALTDEQFIALFDQTSRNECLTAGNNAIGWVVYYDQAANKVKYAENLPSNISKDAILGIVYDVTENEIRAFAPFSPMTDNVHKNISNETSFSACYATAVGAYDKVDGHQVAHVDNVEMPLAESDTMHFTSDTTAEAYANQVGTYVEVEYDSNEQEWYVKAQTLVGKSEEGYDVPEYDNMIHIYGDSINVYATKDESTDTITIERQIINSNIWFNPVVKTVMKGYNGGSGMTVYISEDKSTFTKLGEALVYNDSGEIFPEEELINYDTILTCGDSNKARLDFNDEFKEAFGNVTIKARTKIMAEMSNFEAAEACYNYTPKASLINIRGQYYLPSIYMLTRINANKEILRSATLKNKVKLSWQYVWSCLESSTAYAWYYGINNGYVGNDYKSNHNSVLAVLSC